MLAAISTPCRASGTRPCFASNASSKKTEHAAGTARSPDVRTLARTTGERAGAPTKELGAEPVSQVPWDVAQGGGPVACLKFQKISQDSRRLRAGIRVAHGTRDRKSVV